MFRRALDGRCTDQIIDRIFWGLTNVITKQQLEILMVHFTQQKANGKRDVEVIPQLETGKRYNNQNRKRTIALFNRSVIGGSIKLINSQLESLISSACKLLELSCDDTEAIAVANYITQCYHIGHAGGSGKRRRTPRNQGTVEGASEDDINAGGAVSAGNGRSDE